MYMCTGIVEGKKRTGEKEKSQTGEDRKKAKREKPLPSHTEILYLVLPGLQIFNPGQHV